MFETIKDAKVLAVIATFLFVVGCAGEYEVVIESTTSWSGAIGNSTYSGNGNDRFTPDYTGDELTAVIQKKSSSGTLTGKIVQKGMFGDNVLDEATTKAEYGIITISTY